MAKRLYYKATETPPVSPAIDGGWPSSDNFVRRKLVEAKEASTETLSGSFSNSANDGDLVVQLVSPPLDGAQTVSGTATVISRGRELATADNINNRGRMIRVVSNDGNTVRGTPEVLSWSASTTELSTSLAGQQHMLNGSITSVSAQDGDRIVLEFAYRSTVGGTTPQWESVLGGNGTDHGTTNNDGTGTVAWFETSANLVYKAEAFTLAPANVAQAQATSTPTLTQEHNLTVQNAAQAQTTGTPSLVQQHNLAAQGAAQAQTTDNVVLDVAITLAPANVAQAQAATSPALTQLHFLAVQNVAQSQTAGNVVFTQAHNLVVAAALQSQAAGAVVLTQLHVLAVQAALQTQSVDTPTLTLPVVGPPGLRFGDVFSPAGREELVVAARDGAVVPSGRDGSVQPARAGVAGSDRGGDTRWQ